MPPKTKKCLAKVKPRNCFYKQDLGHIATMFNANDKAHDEIRESLKKISHVKLNGSDVLTPVDEVLRDIWRATKAERKTNRLKESFSD
jgi:hypothetical protein